MEGRRAQFVARGARQRGRRRASRRDHRLAGHRPLGLVCRVDRQARPGPRRAQPGRRPVLRHLGPRADRRRGRPCAAAVLAARPGLGAGPGHRARATPPSSSPASGRPLPAITLAEALATSDVPGGVVNLITGRTAEVAPWLASTATSTPSTSPAPPAPRAELGRPRAGRRREPQAGPPPRRRAASDAVEPDWSRHARPVPDHVVPRDQDRLAPQGPLTLDRSLPGRDHHRPGGGPAGPSGAGKSRLAARLQGAHGWPIVRLDDFYRDEDDPAMPRSEELGHRRLGPPRLLERRRRGRGAERPGRDRRGRHPGLRHLAEPGRRAPRP